MIGRNHRIRHKSGLHPLAPVYYAHPPADNRLRSTTAQRERVRCHSQDVRFRNPQTKDAQQREPIFQ